MQYPETYEVYINVDGNVTTSDPNSVCDVAASKSNRELKARPSSVDSSLSDHQTNEQEEGECKPGLYRQLPLDMFSHQRDSQKRHQASRAMMQGYHP